MAFLQVFCITHFRLSHILYYYMGKLTEQLLIRFGASSRKGQWE